MTLPKTNLEKSNLRALTVKQQRELTTPTKNDSTQLPNPKYSPELMSRILRNNPWVLSPPFAPPDPQRNSSNPSDSEHANNKAMDTYLTQNSPTTTPNGQCQLAAISSLTGYTLAVLRPPRYEPPPPPTTPSPNEPHPHIEEGGADHLLSTNWCGRRVRAQVTRRFSRSATRETGELPVFK